MQLSSHAPGRAALHPRGFRHLRTVGVILALIGGLAILLPSVATFGAELIVAWMLTQPAFGACYTSKNVTTGTLRVGRDQR